jgi:hypothetical protein
MLSLIVIPTLYLWVANHVEPWVARRRARRGGDGQPHVIEMPAAAPAELSH